MRLSNQAVSVALLCLVGACDGARADDGAGPPVLSAEANSKSASPARGPTEAPGQPAVAPIASPSLPKSLPEKRSAPSPSPPNFPAPLAVEGFRPASHVGPDNHDGHARPVTVVLHGNYDRPEWQCDTWRRVAGFHGWVLCPRGVPNSWAPPSADRWTYRGSDMTQREVEASLASLEKRYPSLVSRDRLVLAGFSLGAILAPSMSLSRPGMYSYLFLVEGGVDKIAPRQLDALKRAGVKGIGMAMSSATYRTAAAGLLRRILKRDMKTVLVDMRGAGHDYRDDFGQTGRMALERLLESPR